MRRWLVIALLCLVPTGGRGQAPVTQVAVDTTILILQVFNSYPFPVTVFLDAPGAPRRRVAGIPPMHAGLLAIPSREITGLTMFYVTVQPRDPKRGAYQTGLITREPGKIGIVRVTVGTDSLPRPGLQS